jgi:hypothetical protein
MRSIKQGTLNFTSKLKPVGHIWLNSKQKWLDINKESIQFEGNPDSFEEELVNGVRKMMKDRS